MSRPGKARSWAWIAGGAAALIALSWMAYRDSQDAAPRFPMPVLVVTAAAAIALLAVGVGMLLAAQRARAGADLAPASYRHALRPFGALGGLLVVAFAIRGLAVPADFGRDGPYRAGARDDAEARAPRYQGTASCARCHEVESAQGAGDVHHTVACETCHGPAGGHADAPRAHDLAADRSAAACLLCHRKLTARPGPFPQVDPQAHFKLVGAKEGTACTSCHDPHRPIFLSRPLAEARLHPLVHRCRDCHLNRTDETLERPAAHPAIFQCRTCHTKIAADAAERRHAAVACTSCHLFVRDSEFAGRIVKNDDPRFCLLCHGAGDLRRDDAPAPTIDWTEHRTTFDDTLTETAPCVPCHRDVLHGEPEGAIP